MSKKSWSITISGCVALITALAGFKAFEITSAIAQYESFPEHSESVNASAVVSVDYQPSVMVLGEAVAPQHIELRNEFPGTATRVNYQSGDFVKKGTVIFQIDISDEEANLQAANARQSLAQSIFKRTLELNQSNAASKEKLDSARTDLIVIKSEIARLNSVIRKKTVIAPFDGVLGIHDVRIGEYLQANGILSSLVGDRGYTFVDFSVPQFYPPLATGQAIELRLVTNGPKASLSGGIISAVNPAISSNSKSRRYRARVMNRVLDLPANAAVEVKVPVAVKAKLLAVPTPAVQSDLNGKYVYVLAENQSGKAYRAQKKTVEVVTYQNNMALVNKGVAKDELIAAEGSFKLFEGVLVNVNSQQNTESDGATL